MIIIQYVQIKIHIIYFFYQHYKLTAYHVQAVQKVAKTNTTTKLWQVGTDTIE